MAGALALAPTAAAGQITVTRNYILSTLHDTTNAGARFLPHSYFFGEFAHGYRSSGGEQAWNVKLGGMFELVRFSPRAAIDAAFAQELNANPYDGLGFRPRGAIWEENIFFTGDARGTDYQIGIFHRCRHEIDNSEPRDERLIPAGFVPEERGVILTGLRGGLSSRDLTAGALALRLFVRGEGYVIHTDNRVPYNVQSPDWENAHGAAAAGARAALRLRGPLAVYVRGWQSAMFFGGPDRGVIGWSGRVEAGVRGIGRAAGLDVYASTEHFFDDVAYPYPHPSNTVSAGLRVSATPLF